MFRKHIQEVLHQVNTETKFIPHKNLDEEVNLLTLVKKRRGFLSDDYEVMPLTLGDLIPAFAGFSEFTEKTLIEDYKHSSLNSGKAGIQVDAVVASGGVGAGALRQRETSSVDINSKTADIRKMKEICNGQKINRVDVPELRKGEVLGFVKKIVFNTNDVHLCGRTEVDGSFGARWNIINFFMKGKMEDSTSFTVPAGQTYGYRLNELKFEKEEEKEFNLYCIVQVLCDKEEEQQPDQIRYVEKTLEPETFEPDDSSEETFETLETLQQVREELLRTETVLQPLAHLPRVTRFNLFQSLSVLSEDRDALTLLKLQMGQWRVGEPFDEFQSRSVYSVLQLIGAASASISHETTVMTREAFYLLVSAMDKLPEHVTLLIAKYRPDSLRGLNQLVSDLMEHGQAHLSESLPAALQDGGQLHWLAMFLCSSDESLRELSELTTVAGDEPGVLLLALCVAVRGLNMLRQ